METLKEEEVISVENRWALLEVAFTDLGRLCFLVRDIDLLCRLKAGQICFQTELLDPNDTLQLALDSFLKQAPESALSKLRVEWATPLSSVWIYGDRMGEGVKRLLENAFRFTATGGVKVDVDVQVVSFAEAGTGRQATSASSMLKICVSDAGRGMDSDKLVRVFDCFYREEAYLQRMKGGMGLGLTICRSLVEGMGGAIWAESSGKEQGSQVCFTLPVYAVP